MTKPDSNKFSPAWWIPGPHAQTLWAQFLRRRLDPELISERLPTDDGDHVELYHHEVAPDRPRLLLLHGLEGSHRSHYIGGLVRQAENRGWNSSVLVFRGCGPRMNAAPRLYHSGETSDLALAVRTFVERAPHLPLLLAGVSLGGNVLLKFLGEAGSRAPRQIRAAATVSVPYDLEEGAKHLRHGFARVYDRHFLRSLRRKAQLKLGQYPGLFDSRKLAAARSIHEFDDAVTAPVHGFSGAHDYYSKSSAIGFLPEIRVPTLLLSAEDDPFLPASVLSRVRDVAARNPEIQIEFTTHGGHAGFIAGRTPFRPAYWAEDRLMRFFDSWTAGQMEPNRVVA
jgi:predicted alpha/beta-fold hydrolase